MPAFLTHFAFSFHTCSRAVSGESSPSAFLTGADYSSLSTSNTTNLSHTSNTSK